MHSTVSQHLLLEEAELFIRSCYRELGKNVIETEQRVQEVKQMIDVKGTYEHTFEELNHGAKMAWRNSNRCIGRLFWELLEVYDARAIETADDVANALFNHIELATNGGKIRPIVTVFKADPGDAKPLVNILNHQLISYAGYETENGVVGDPNTIAFTKNCISLGWISKKTPFDVLPLMIQIGDHKPRLFVIPQEIVMEVPIIHPEFSSFAELNLKWYAVPIVSNMRLEIGGISYSAAPFNGWYVGTEIGARNLSDTQRYNMLPQVSAIMGLDTRKEATLWKDKALVELNIAVLHSYKIQGVMIVDHHTAAQQFMRFEEKEQKNDREVTGKWSWLISPLSPATTAVFHKSYEDKEISPNFFYRE